MQLKRLPALEEYNAELVALGAAAELAEAAVAEERRQLRLLVDERRHDRAVARSMYYESLGGGAGEPGWLEGGRWVGDHTGNSEWGVAGDATARPGRGRRDGDPDDGDPGDCDEENAERKL